MDKWEYLVGVKVHSKKEREQFLSRLGYEAIGQGTRYTNWLKTKGREGWELVAVFPLSQTIGETRDVVAAFKRQIGS